MARAAAKRFFGTLLFLVGLVAFLGFIFLLFANSQDIDEVPGVEKISDVGQVIGIVLGAVALLLAIIILARAGRKDDEELFFIPEKDQVKLAYSADDWPEDYDDAPGEGRDIQVYHLPAVERQVHAWEKTNRRGMWAYHYPRAVDEALYANDYIPIDRHGNRIMLRTLIAGPADGQKAPMKKPRKLYLEKIKKEHDEAQAQKQAEKVVAQVAATGAGDGSQFMQELQQRVQGGEDDAPADGPRGEVYYGYSGENPRIETVEGITAEQAASLRANGVETVARLCWEDPNQLATRLRVQPQDVARWQSTAELMKVPGIGGTYAAALAGAGVDGISGLKRRPAGVIAAEVNRRIEESGGAKVSERRVQGWQDAARDLRRTKQRVPQS